MTEISLHKALNIIPLTWAFILSLIKTHVCNISSIRVAVTTLHYTDQLTHCITAPLTSSAESDVRLKFLDHINAKKTQQFRNTFIILMEVVVMILHILCLHFHTLEQLMIKVFDPLKQEERALHKLH